MPLILPKGRRSVKQRLLRDWRRCQQAGPRLRYLSAVNLLNGRGAAQTADVLGVHNTTVYRVARRFRERGEWGLLDGRENNGAAKPVPGSVDKTAPSEPGGNPVDFGPAPCSLPSGLR